jgi:hypothetical protein
MVEQLVAEDPLIPDVDAGIASGRAGEVSGEMERERPGKDESYRYVSRESEKLQLSLSMHPRSREE